MDQLKKLQYSRQQIRKLTADPIMSIESTKQKSNKFMARQLNNGLRRAVKSP